MAAVCGLSIAHDRATGDSTMARRARLRRVKSVEASRGMSLNRERAPTEVPCPAARAAEVTMNEADVTTVVRRAHKAGRPSSCWLWDIGRAGGGGGGRWCRWEATARGGFGRESGSACPSSWLLACPAGWDDGPGRGGERPPSAPLLLARMSSSSLDSLQDTCAGW